MISSCHSATQHANSHAWLVMAVGAEPIVSVEAELHLASTALESTWLVSPHGDRCGTSPDGTWPACN